MRLTAQHYIFTNADRERIESWGYVIEGLPSGQQLEHILPNLLPNFDLASLLEVVERDFTPTTPISIKRKIIYRESGKSLQVLYYNLYKKEDDAVVFDRTFYKEKDEIFVDHNFCLVPQIHQGKGLIKPVFQASLQQYVNMDVRKIIVHADLGGGGYTWARYGFVAINRDEVQRILEEARRTLSIIDLRPVEVIFEKYYFDQPTGTDFPMILWAGLPYMKEVLRGSDWWGELDLHNPEQIRNFSNYVFRT